MNNTQKDRFEKKLIRFIREWDKKKPFTMSDWQEFSATLYKKYGFTDEEWHKAIRLIRSYTEKSAFKTKTYERKIARKKMNNGLVADLKSGKQDYYNEAGEAEIEAEDRWIADVFDTYDYDKEDMSR